MRDIILASASPRRRELLSGMGVEFSVCVPDADEKMDASAPPEDEVRRVACLKAQSVLESAKGRDALVIAADTVVCIDGLILGKPKDREDARGMLRRLSGRTHSVHTGLCAALRGSSLADTVSSLVSFRELSEKEIADYVAGGEPMDKAGAYGVQGRGAAFVRHIDGDFFAVMGLPVCRLTEMLMELGWFD